jgi:hypothetical protein
VTSQSEVVAPSAARAASRKHGVYLSARDPEAAASRGAQPGG